MNRNEKKELFLLLLEQQRRKAIGSFWSFCLYYDTEFFTDRPFMFQAAEALQWLHDEYVAGRPRRISISMPPRSGKSYICSLFCAWWLGKFPELAVMRNACTAKLYMKFSRDVRAIIKSRKYQSIFKEVAMSKESSSVMGWNLNTAKQVSYFGSGVGGTIIGFGANLALSDDLYSGLADALSPTYNETVHFWKQSDHDSRKELNCPEVYIGTRWTKEDVIGKAIENGKIDKEVKIAAMTPDNRSFCEKVKSTAEYLEIKGDIDETIWEAEYQQEPIENKGSLFPESELGFFDIEDFQLSKSEYNMIPVDPADTGGDFYAAVDSHLIGKYVFITNVIFNTFGTDVNIPATVDMAVASKANHVQVEGNSGWVVLGKDVKSGVQARMPNCEVRIVKQHLNKDTRILSFAAWIKNYVRFRKDYKDDRQYAAFMKNVKGYLREGKNLHDDGPDLLAQLAEYYRRNFAKRW